MKLKHVKFNHEAEGFYDAIGITDDIMMKCRERILFSTFTNALQSIELFEDRNDAPRELTTITGDFQKTLSIIEDEIEYAYTLMEFSKTHEMGVEAFARWELQRRAKNSKTNKKKSMMLDIMDMLTELKMEHEKTSNETADINLKYGFTPKGLLKRVELTKNSQYDFNVYLNMVERYNHSNQYDRSKDSDTDIDDFLRNILNQNDEDDDD